MRERPWALPLVPLYWAGLRAKDVLRGSGVLGKRRLRWPVVSVGSVSAGGAGKTPAVIALAELLRGAGWNVDVLSRGYGREGTAVERVEPSLPEAARRFGDEPVLIAVRTGLPVWVGGSRFAAGMAAEQAAGDARGRSVHLLDDGFQHRALGRAFDLVLVTAEDLADWLLPAGNRREPLSALRRAGAVLIRQDEAETVVPQLSVYLPASVPVWTIRRRLVLAGSSSDGGYERYVAFCGIARPEGFFGMLRGAGLELAGEITYPDHHRYTLGDVRRLVKSCHLGACRFITTEKDAVKLGAELRAELEEAGGLRIARLEAEFADPALVLATVEARLG